MSGWNSHNMAVDFATLLRGSVDTLRDDGIRVVCDGDAIVTCDVLQTGLGELLLARGDAVLLVHLTSTRDRGVILGRLGPTQAREAGAAAPPTSVEVPDVSATDHEVRDDGIPDELVLEAKSSLTLRVGDGSITIRADGKILIKGKDLVSHAQRTNRIKGGSVAIN